MTRATNAGTDSSERGALLGTEASIKGLATTNADADLQIELLRSHGMQKVNGCYDNLPFRDSIFSVQPVERGYASLGEVIKHPLCIMIEAVLE